MQNGYVDFVCSPENYIQKNLEFSMLIILQFHIALQVNSNWFWQIANAT